MQNKRKRGKPHRGTRNNASAKTIWELIKLDFFFPTRIEFQHINCLCFGSKSIQRQTMARVLKRSDIKTGRCNLPIHPHQLEGARIAISLTGLLLSSKYRGNVTTLQFYPGKQCSCNHGNNPKNCKEGGGVEAFSNNCNIATKCFLTQKLNSNRLSSYQLQDTFSAVTAEVS